MEFAGGYTYTCMQVCLQSFIPLFTHIHPPLPNTIFTLTSQEQTAEWLVLCSSPSMAHKDNLVTAPVAWVKSALTATLSQSGDSNRHSALL